MGLLAPFHAPAYPYYSGTVSGAAIATVGPVVSLGEHWYELDLASDRMRIASLPALRPQTDTSDAPGEQSLSVEGLWRRTIQSWEHGAGQDHYDRANRDRLRFRSSRGIDPWTEGQLSLLDQTSLIETEANGWTSLTVGEIGGVQRLVAAGGNGKAITVQADGTESTISGLTGTLYAASNGSQVYIAASDGIYKVDSGTAASMFNTNVNAANRLGFAKNRLIATVGAQLWDVIDGTTSSPHYTNPWPGWTWTGICEGQAVVYACGYAGDKGLIFRIPLKSDGTGLDAPSVAQELPHGELPYAIVSYVGFLIVATSKGVRFAIQGADGELELGALVGGGPSRCLEPQAEFCWFGWDAMHGDSSGLGRTDITRFVEPLAPAYATDLTAEGQAGVVNAVVTFDDRRFFTAGTGLYRQLTGTKLTTGYIETGLMTFNLHDDKVAVFANVAHAVLESGDAVTLQLRTVEVDYTLLGSSNTPNTTGPHDPLPTNHVRSGGHELKLTFTNGGGGDGPVLYTITLAVQPAPFRSMVWVLPLIVAEKVALNSVDYPFDARDEYHYLIGLVHSQQLVRLRWGNQQDLVFVEDFEWIPDNATEDGGWFNGTMVIRCKHGELEL